MTSVGAPSERRTRLAAYALVRDADGRLLLCRIAAGDSAAGYWTLPGGGVEWGEDPADAVLRELGEETGLSGVVDAVAGVYSRTYEPGWTADGLPLHAVGIVYHVIPAPGDLRVELDGSTDTCAWFAPDDLEAVPLVTLVSWALRLPVPPR